MTSKAFAVEEFWPAFLADLNRARARVLIQSPFVGATRIKALIKEFAPLIHRGVAICVFIQEPRDWNTPPRSTDTEATYRLGEVRLLLDILSSSGVHVNLRKNIHGKLAVIDDRVLWEGSLNILSHTSTTEHMRRLVRKEEILGGTKMLRRLGCSDCQANYSRYGTPRERWNKSRLGEVVATQRKNLGLSQRELGRKSGLPHARISQIELGNNVTLDTLQQLIAPLGLEIMLVPELNVPSVAILLNQTSSPPD